MFGLAALIGCVIYLIGCFIVSIKNDNYDAEQRYNAKQNNEWYYMDWKGNYRSTSTGHRILIHTIDLKTGDKVDLDMKTNQILRNYTQEEKERECQKKDFIATQSNLKREEARRNGFAYYLSTDPCIDKITGKETYVITTRRVSDNLIVFSTSDYCQDKKTNLYLRVYNKDLEYFEYCKKKNRDMCKKKWLQNQMNMTEEELLDYAKK